MIPKIFWVKKAMPQQYTLQHTKINSLKNSFVVNATQFRATALILNRLLNTKNQYFIKNGSKPRKIFFF